MADWSCTGHIVGIKYNENNVVVTLSENKNGYKKKDGTIVDDMILNWRCTFRALQFKSFISSHFSSGMYVQIKGEQIPFVFGKEGEKFDGYTIIGQTINIASYPKNIRAERKMIKESLSHADEQPDLKGYTMDDF